METVYHVNQVVKLVQILILVANVLHHWSFNKTVVLLNVVMDISYQELLVLVVLKTVLVVPQIINVSIVKMDSFYMEELAMLTVLQEQLQIYKLINVFLVTVHAELVQIILVLALAVNQEKVIYKWQDKIKNVLNNVLKELSPKTMFVKYVTLDVLNVLALLTIVLHALLVDSFIMELVGITAQVYWLIIVV